jgi:hypothetical protein
MTYRTAFRYGRRACVAKSYVANPPVVGKPSDEVKSKPYKNVAIQLK